MLPRTTCRRDCLAVSSIVTSVVSFDPVVASPKAIFRAAQPGRLSAARWDARAPLSEARRSSLGGGHSQVRRTFSPQAVHKTPRAGEPENDDELSQAEAKCL